MMDALMQAHQRQRLFRRQRIARHLGDERHVFQRRQARHQIIELKDKSHMIASVTRQLTLAGFMQRPAAKEHFAAGAAIQAAQNVEQGGLAGP
jgi:hypothetical protein